MAYTKIFAIRKQLRKTVNYAVNPEKTELSSLISYAANPEKTEQRLFESVINCYSVETAYQEMQATKKRWGKQGGILGYHLIQSFAPGEVDAEKAHQIGRQLADRLFGNQYEVVIGTHLDQKHLHNHIVVNSVAMTDGGKYHSNITSYYSQVRTISDELCRAHQLSVINPKEYGRHYAEWQAEQHHKPTIRSMIRQDIDAVIADAYHFQSFLMLLEKRGYRIKHHPKRKYTTVQPPGGKRPIRLASLGEQYTEEAIRRRITEQRTGKQSATHKKETQPERKGYRPKYPLPKKKTRKITGFLALYFRYVYLLKSYNRGKRKPYLTTDLRREVTKLDQYQKQFLYLMRHQLETAEQISHHAEVLEEQKKVLINQRGLLYGERKAAKDEISKQNLTEEIHAYTKALKEIRTGLKICQQVQQKYSELQRQKNRQMAWQNNRKQETGKERVYHEYQWRNR